MKPFSLEEYLKNPERKVVTRDDKRVRIVCTDRLGAYPVIGLAKTDKVETALFYTDTGRIYPEVPSEYDLFFAPEKKEGWANIYLCEGEYSLDDVIYSSRIDAEESGKKFEDYFTTIQIEWEE